MPRLINSKNIHVHDLADYKFLLDYAIESVFNELISKIKITKLNCLQDRQISELVHNFFTFMVTV